MQIVITNDGLELMSKLISETATAQFTKISASDHDYSNIDPKTLIELEDVRQTVLVSGISRVDKTLIEIIAAFDNKDLETGYYAKALGVFAEDQDGNEILFCVGVEPDHTSYLPPFSGRTTSSITYRLKIKVNNSEQVIMEALPGANVTVEQFEEFRGELNEQLAQKISEHNADAHSHQDIRDLALNSMQQGDAYTKAESDETFAAHNAAAGAHPSLQINSANLESRIEMIELKYSTNVTGNPFAVSFGSLSGLIVTNGCYDATNARITF